MNTTSTNMSKGFGFWASLPLSRKLLIAIGASRASVSIGRQDRGDIAGSN